jgi:branched-chain amino acid transport system substrate-binding protein
MTAHAPRHSSTAKGKTGEPPGKRGGLGRRSLLAASGALAFVPAGAGRAAGAGGVRIGEINSYTGIPAFTLPYRNGWQLAVEEINGRGGAAGRRLEVISRDDAGRPQDALRFAGELLDGAHVDLLAGGYYSNIGLALSDFAESRGVPYIAGEPLTDALVWEKGNAVTFRVRPSTYMQAAMLVEEAARLPARIWASVAPNYEYGQSAVKWFFTLLRARRPDIRLAVQQWPALGRIDAAATVEALAAAAPEAIFNVTFGPDLTALVRAGNARGLFEKRAVVSLLTGEPEYLEPLGAETPEGWIVTGYPWQSLETEEHRAFRTAYERAYDAPPRMGSVVGYALIQAIAAGVGRLSGSGLEAWIAAFRGARFPTPFGPAYFRPLDHQSTLGTFVGRTAQRNGQGVMVDWRYVPGETVMPPDAEVRRLRPVPG